MDLKSVGEAIKDTRQGLEAGGYQLECEDVDGRLVLSIKALQGTCEECLVPKTVMASIVTEELREKGIMVRGIDIVYPADRL